LSSHYFLDALLAHWTAASVKGRVLLTWQIAATCRLLRRLYGPFTSVVQKIALTAIVDQAIIQTRGHPYAGEGAHGLSIPS
jgi:hypothetical protein